MFQETLSRPHLDLSLASPPMDPPRFALVVPIRPFWPIVIIKPHLACIFCLLGLAPLSWSVLNYPHLASTDMEPPFNCPLWGPFSIVSQWIPLWASDPCIPISFGNPFAIVPLLLSLCLRFFISTLCPCTPRMDSPLA